MTCECIVQMNAALAPRNARLAQSILLRDGQMIGSPVIIAVEKLNTAKKASLPRLMATYCPFCGQKYGDGAALGVGSVA